MTRAEDLSPEERVRNAWAGGIFRWRNDQELIDLLNDWPGGVTMAQEKRRDSSDTVPIPREELERMLGLEREYRPVPDDETPTNPDLAPACPECKGASGRECAICGGEGVVLGGRK